MSFINKISNRYFYYFRYFYSHIGNRIFGSLVLSLLVGIMDGFGLAMFLPLLQMVDGSHAHAENVKMGNMSFLTRVFEYMGIGLTLEVVLVVIFIFFSLKGILKFAEGYIR